MATNRKRKQPRKPRAKTKRPKAGDWRDTPEYRLHCKRYGEFLSRQPLYRALMENDEEKIEKLLNEMGI